MFGVCFVGEGIVVCDCMVCNVCVGVMVFCGIVGSGEVVGELVLCWMSEMCFAFIKATKCGSTCCCCIVILWSDV